MCVCVCVCVCKIELDWCRVCSTLAVCYPHMTRERERGRESERGERVRGREGGKEINEARVPLGGWVCVCVCVCVCV